MNPDLESAARVLDNMSRSVRDDICALLTANNDNGAASLLATESGLHDGAVAAAIALLDAEQQIRPGIAGAPTVPATDEILRSETDGYLKQHAAAHAIVWYALRTGTSLTRSVVAIEELTGGPAPQAAATANVSDAALRERIAPLVKSGRKIEAIKLYREATGVGLAEAKNAVEAFDATGSFSHVSPGGGIDLGRAAPPVPDLHVEAVLNLIGAGKLDEAAAVYARVAGINLAEASRVTAEIAVPPSNRPEFAALSQADRQKTAMSAVQKALETRNVIEAVRVARIITGNDLQQVRLWISLLNNPVGRLITNMTTGKGCSTGAAAGAVLIVAALALLA